MSSAEYALRFVHPADRYIVAEEIRKALENDDSGFRHYLEHRIIKTDGTVGHMAVHYSTVKDSEGKIIRFYGGNQDITKRKNTENDLRRSQAQLKSVIEEQKKVESELRDVNRLFTNLAEQVPGAIYQYQLFPDGRSCFPYASPGLTEIYELAPEEVRYDATPFLERLHPEDREAALAAVDESARTLGLFQCEFRVILPRQGVRWRVCRSKPIPMEDGSILWHGMISDATDRKEAEEKLSHSRDLMSYIIEHDRSAVAIHDKNLNYIYVSRRYLEQYKVREQEVIGRHHYEVFPDLPQKWREVHRKALQGEVSSAEEDTYLREDGAVDWTRWECRPWYESDGSIGGIVVYTEVITERKKAENALRLMVSQYRSLFRTCPDGYCLFDKNGRLLEVNDAYCSMVGYSREKLVSRHVSDLDALESREESANHMNEVIEKGYARFETQHKSQAGPNLDVEISVSYWQEGERFLCFVRDISQRKIFEMTLRESEEKFRSFVENVNDIIFSLTKEGILTYVSPNWFFFMGEPDESAVGRSLQQYIHPDDVPLFCEYLSQITLQWDKKTGVEYRIRHRDGSWLWHTSNASALRSQDGASLGYLGVARDITEKKKIQDFMVQTEKIMSLGTMAAGMAHEINNPLSIISQGVQNVLRRTRDDLPGNHKAAQESEISLEHLQQYMEKRNIYRSLEAILDAVKRSSDIVSNMLQFSRRSDLFPVDCDINLILEKSITLAATDYDLKKRYDFRNIRILKEFSLQTEVPCISSELEQVFLNILRNSAQSFENVQREEPTINLRTWEDPEINWAFVEIEDNGCGIEEQSLKRIFDPFFTTKKVGEGTGLGLSVSHHIVTQRHQGRIIAESKVGHWTRLRIQLPLRSSFENAPAGNPLQTQ